MARACRAADRLNFAWVRETLDARQVTVVFGHGASQWPQVGGHTKNCTVCVCVNYLKKCKLLIWDSLSMLFVNLQVATGSLHGCRQRSSMQLTRIWSLINSTYLHPVFISLWWAVANPRPAVPFSTILMSLLFLYGLRNLSRFLGTIWLGWREGSASNSIQFALAMAMVASPTHSCQVYLDCFCT